MAYPTFAGLLLTLFVVQAAARSTCPNFFPGDVEDPNVRKIITANGGPSKFVPPNGMGSSRKNRIVGGSPTDLDSDLPYYIVHIDRACTGTIVNAKWIMTAAHCFTDTSSTIYFFNSDTQLWDIQIGVARTVPHPDYNDDTFENDILLAELESEVPADALFVTINRKRGIPRGFSMTRAAGFGVTSSGGSNPGGLLRQVDVPYRNEADCDRFISGYVHQAMMCAGYVCGGCDSCQGDSGGPLFQYTDDGEFYQVGITSFGNGCAARRSPGYYARVSNYKKWIRQTLRPYGFWTGGMVPQIKVRKGICPQTIAARILSRK